MYIAHTQYSVKYMYNVHVHVNGKKYTKYSVLNLHFFLSLCTGEAPELHYTLPVQSEVLIRAHGFDVFVHRAGRTSPGVKESYTMYMCNVYTL